MKTLAGCIAVALFAAACSSGQVTEAPPVGPGTTAPSTSTTLSVTAATEGTKVPLATAGRSEPFAGLVAVRIVSGINRPVFATAPVGDPRLFLVEQEGTILIVDGSGLRVESFLDIADRVGSGGLEQGLLGLAFHPDFLEDDRFFVAFTDRNGDSNVRSYRLDPVDPDRADPTSGIDILSIRQPASNHNGGMLQFGTDGYLYLGVGDGGDANDQFGNAQHPDTTLGSILRIDIDGATPYAVPPSNPFLSGRAPAVWAFGVRNPWRFDIDRDTGLMYVADVGQASWEEVTVIDTAVPGQNLGWPILEGLACFGAAGCDGTGTVVPSVVYGHDEGCSITGGLVYRGSKIPELAGHYFYADWCAGWVRSFRFEAGRSVDVTDWSVDLGFLGPVTSFG